MSAPRHHAEDGFTITELMVAILIGTTVMLATLQSLDHFRASTVRQTKRLGAEDQVRAFIDRTTRDLRGAGTIVRADPQDLVYTMPDPAGTKTKRVCVSDGRLYAFSSTASTVADSSCASGTVLATLAATATTGFTYDGLSVSATPGTVKNVGIVFGLNAGRNTSTVISSASRRTGSMLLTDPMFSATCTPSGALLSLDAGLLGAGAVSVAYTTTAGASIGVQTTGGVLIAKGAVQVVATVTDSGGRTASLVKDVECG